MKTKTNKSASDETGGAIEKGLVLTDQAIEAAKNQPIDFSDEFIDIGNEIALINADQYDSILEAIDKQEFEESPAIRSEGFPFENIGDKLVGLFYGGTKFKTKLNAPEGEMVDLEAALILAGTGGDKKLYHVTGKNAIQQLKSGVSRGFIKVGTPISIEFVDTKKMPAGTMKIYDVKILTVKPLNA